jgi:hypothetical protein
VHARVFGQYGVARWSTISCWRRARFSSMRSRRERTPEQRVRRTTLTKGNMVANLPAKEQKYNPPSEVRSFRYPQGLFHRNVLLFPQDGRLGEKSLPAAGATWWWQVAPRVGRVKRVLASGREICSTTTSSHSTGMTLHWMACRICGRPLQLVAGNARAIWMRARWARRAKKFNQTTSVQPKLLLTETPQP